MPKVEFLFDFGSPNAYLATWSFPEIEKRQGVKFEYVPVLLGGVFKLTGNRSPAETNRRHQEQARIPAARDRAASSSSTASRASGPTRSSRSTR